MNAHSPAASAFDIDRNNGSSTRSSANRRPGSWTLNHNRDSPRRRLARRARGIASLTRAITACPVRGVPFLEVKSEAVPFVLKGINGRFLWSLTLPTTPTRIHISLPRALSRDDCAPIFFSPPRSHSECHKMVPAARNAPRPPPRRLASSNLHEPDVILRTGEAYRWRYVYKRSERYLAAKGEGGGGGG